MVPFLITPVIQSYDWGKAGSTSLISKLGYTTASGPLAEAWFGTHSKGSSQVASTLQPLSDIERKHPTELLGETSIKRFGSKVPFLFKVLSIQKPLSIQVHPDAFHAARLHERNPAEYLEANTKPEIAIAVTEVRMLNGFKSENAIRSLIARIPEFGAFVARCNPDSIRDIASEIFRADSEFVSVQCAKLAERLHVSGAHLPEEQLFLELAAEFPDDVGLFSAFLLNELTLQPGEGIFTAPGTLHAYISGDLLECMKLSDLVIRAGLTPKRRDVEALLEVSSHHHGEPKILRSHGHDTHYHSQAEEFQVERISGEQHNRTIPTSGGVELYFLLSGTAILNSDNTASLQMNRGDAAIVPACVSRISVSLQGDLYRVSIPACARLHQL